MANCIRQLSNTTVPGVYQTYTYVPKESGEVRICVDFDQHNNIAKKMHIQYQGWGAMAKSGW